MPTINKIIKIIHFMLQLANRIDSLHICCYTWPDYTDQECTSYCMTERQGGIQPIWYNF